VRDENSLTEEEEAVGARRLNDILGRGGGTE
jgi:hypothetical protein